MSLAVIYTPPPHARTIFISINSFIVVKFGERTAKKFIDKADKIIELIAQQPFIFKDSGIADDIRLGFITKQCSVFYRAIAENIQLLYFWDNRQQPILL